MLKYLIEKEFKLFIRHPFLPRMVLFLPCMMILVLPWAADLITKNVNLVVVDNDHTPLSSRLTGKATSSRYFNFTATTGSYDEAMVLIEKGDADIILEIPNNFEKDLVKTGVSNVQIAANTVNGTKGSLGSTYLSAIVSSFAAEASRKELSDSGKISPRVEVITQIRYNPSMDYKLFMVPAFIVMIVTLICGFLPALNVVMEKESGTIEQMNVTPVSKLQFILGKLIPFWIMGIVVITLSLFIAWLIYGIWPAGSLITLYTAFTIYTIALSGFGIVISNYSSTMQQAMFLIFFFVIIFILLSGIFTPVSSMPDWAQKITLINPLRYFITIMRSIFFKASSIGDLWKDFAALGVFVAVSNTWAILSYRKRN